MLKGCLLPKDLLKLESILSDRGFRVSVNKENRDLDGSGRVKIDRVYVFSDNVSGLCQPYEGHVFAGSESMTQKDKDLVNIFLDQYKFPIPGDAILAILGGAMVGLAIQGSFYYSLFFK